MSGVPAKLSGSVWSPVPSPLDNRILLSILRYDSLKQINYATIHYRHKSDTPVIDQIKAVIKGGCKWVQISMPDASDSEIREAVEAIKPLCIEKEVFLILESNAELAQELNVGGVCLHKDDIPASKARMILGPAAVIGVVVDSFQDILSVSSLDIDYFMLAPFRKSDCKNDESPELGVEGVKSICDKMEGNEINIPRVAEGGITYDDIPLC